MTEDRRKVADRHEVALGAEPATPGGPGSFRILFVCTGNTCRSPMALGLARRMLEDWGWDRVQVESAGVAAPPRAPASGGALRASMRHGIDLTGHRSQPLTQDLVDLADVILTMSIGHMGAVEAMGGAGRAELITDAGRDLSDPNEHSEGVLDPIGGDDDLYEETFEQLEELVERALKRLVPAGSR